MWNAVIAGIVFQHRSIEGLVPEMHRNPALLHVCGFDALPRQSKPNTTLRQHPHSGKPEVISIPQKPVDTIPNCWKFYRFLGNLIALEEEQGVVGEMIKSSRILVNTWVTMAKPSTATVLARSISKRAKLPTWMATGANMKPGVLMLKPVKNGTGPKAGLGMAFTSSPIRTTRYRWRFA